jgi:hypothetical protein
MCGAIIAHLYIADTQTRQAEIFGTARDADMQQLDMKNDPIKVSQSLITQMLRLTQLAPSTFGQKSGVSPSTVTRALKGQLKAGVDMKTMVRLADEAGVEITLSRNHNRYETNIGVELVRRSRGNV